MPSDTEAAVFYPGSSLSAGFKAFLPVGAIHAFAHTIPFRNSSSRYLVPRHTIPSFHRV
jgi:hypothetical protein